MAAVVTWRGINSLEGGKSKTCLKMSNSTTNWYFMKILKESKNSIWTCVCFVLFCFFLICCSSCSYSHMWLHSTDDYPACPDISHDNALEIADLTQPYGSSDTLLRILVEHSKDKRGAWSGSTSAGSVTTKLPQALSSNTPLIGTSIQTCKWLFLLFFLFFFFVMYEPPMLTFICFLQRYVAHGKVPTEQSREDGGQEH